MAKRIGFVDCAKAGATQGAATAPASPLSTVRRFAHAFLRVIASLPRDYRALVQEPNRVGSGDLLLWETNFALWRASLRAPLTRKIRFRVMKILPYRHACHNLARSLPPKFSCGIVQRTNRRRRRQHSGRSIYVLCRSRVAPGASTALLRRLDGRDARCNFKVARISLRDVLSDGGVRNRQVAFSREARRDQARLPADQHL